MDSYPLQWPEGWPRTERPKRSRFDVSLPRARDELLNEIRLMGGRYPVISSNLATRRDGLPYANQKEPSDKGVAVYFQDRHGRPKVFACDRWDQVADNIRAIGKTLESLRGIERWGVTEAMERAFAGFDALPPPKSWRDFFGDVQTREDLKRRYREQAKKMHPDSGGSEAAMAELNAHYQEAERELSAS
jgi:hypothetical protein